MFGDQRIAVCPQAWTHRAPQGVYCDQVSRFRQTVGNVLAVFVIPAPLLRFHQCTQKDGGPCPHFDRNAIFKPRPHRRVIRNAGRETGFHDDRFSSVLRSRVQSLLRLDNRTTTKKRTSIHPESHNFDCDSLTDRLIEPGRPDPGPF